MTSSLTFWIAAAVLLCWGIGAYNRLVRLRGDANAAFGALEAELDRQVRLVDSCLPDGQPQPSSQFRASASSCWDGLHSAAAQLMASLALARLKSLEPEGIAALGAAQSVLALAWARAEREDAHDLAGPRLPPSLTEDRARLVAQTEAAAQQFNAAVERYNAAIAQFPAMLLAWLFGFKPGRGLQTER